MAERTTKPTIAWLYASNIDAVVAEDEMRSKGLIEKCRLAYADENAELQFSSEFSLDQGVLEVDYGKFVVLYSGKYDLPDVIQRSPDVLAGLVDHRVGGFKEQVAKGILKTIEEREKKGMKVVDTYSSETLADVVKEL